MFVKEDACKMSEGRTWTREKQPAKLPNMEMSLYYVLWSIPLTYSYYSIYRFTADNQNNFYDHTLETGWSWIGGRKDNYDFELRFWKRWVFRAWPFVAGHIVLGQICRYLDFRVRTAYCMFEFFLNNTNRTFQKRQLIMTFYDVCAISCLLSPQAVLLVTLNVFAVATVAYLTRSLAATWLLLCILIYLLQTENKYPETYHAKFVKGLCYHDFDTIVLFRYATFFAYLKMASLGHELINTLNKDEQNADSNENNNTGSQNVRHRTEGQENKENADLADEEDVPSSESKLKLTLVSLDIMQYIFYLPVYFTGPLFTFQDFNIQMAQPIASWSKDRIKVIVLDTLRVLFWGFTWEFSLHYIYFYSIQENEQLLNLLSYWQIAGEICMIVPFFYIKYIVIYGLPGNIARLDQITPPNTPTCVAATYKYSEDWRLFDRGLYAILIRHIYIPLGGSRHGPFRQFLAAIACFSFTCFWHGSLDYILAWTAFNLVIVGAEALAYLVVNKKSIKEFERKHLTGASVRRLSTLFWIPMRLLHTMATVTFIGGVMPTKIFIQKMFVEGFPSVTITVSVVYYLFLQVCMEGHRRRHERHRTEKLKKA